MIWALERRRMGWVGRGERKNIAGGRNRMSGGSTVEENWHETKVIASDENS